MLVLLIALLYGVPAFLLALNGFLNVVMPASDLERKKAARRLILAFVWPLWVLFLFGVSLKKLWEYTEW
jgi:hypothetical protein